MLVPVTVDSRLTAADLCRSQRTLRALNALATYVKEDGDLSKNLRQWQQQKRRSAAATDPEASSKSLLLGSLVLGVFSGTTMLVDSSGVGAFTAGLVYTMTKLAQQAQNEHRSDLHQLAEEARRTLRCHDIGPDDTEDLGADFWTKWDDTITALETTVADIEAYRKELQDRVAAD